MRKILSSLFVLIGLLLVSVAGYQYVDHKLGIQKAMAEAEAIVEQTEQLQSEFHSTEAADLLKEQLIAKSRFNPEDNDVIGLLSIPKIDAKLPIIEGTDDEMLDRGVGHYSTTAYPMDNEQILLSGHRDTVFKQLGNLSIGDQLVVEMSYGIFEYEIREMEIVDKDDTTVIGPKGEEVLTISTCYPFGYIGDAPDRYIIYAYPT